MAENVIQFRSAGNANDVLEQSVGQYKDVLILGYDENGNFDARSTTTIDASEILWMVEKFKANLLNGVYSSRG